MLFPFPFPLSVREPETEEGCDEDRREEGVEEGESADVAMTRKVVRSKRMTSVALQLRAKVVRCRVRISALGMMVWTILDQA